MNLDVSADDHDQHHDGNDGVRCFRSAMMFQGIEYTLDCVLLVSKLQSYYTTRVSRKN